MSRDVGVELMLPRDDLRAPSLLTSHSASLSSRECDRESENRDGGLILSLKLLYSCITFCVLCTNLII